MSDRCPNCDGGGMMEYFRGYDIYDFKTCPICKGTGKKEVI